MMHWIRYFRSFFPTLIVLAVFFLLVHAGTAQPVAELTPSQAIDLLGKMSQVPSGQDFFKGATYTGSAQCKSCHELQYSEWQATWHSKMLRAPAKQIVVGNFNTTVRFESVDALALGDSLTQPKQPKKKVHFDIVTSEKDGKYFFTIQDNDRNQSVNDQSYEVVWVVGGNWEQTYHVKIKDYLFPAPLRWSVKFGEWELGLFQPENWVTYVEGTNPPQARPRKPEDFLAASVFENNKLQIPTIRFSDAGCMGCHTTGYEFARVESATGSGLFHWQMQGSGEPGIGCERCHGPGSKHVAEAEAAKKANTKLGATTIVHGLKDLSPRQQSQVCAQCHGRMTHRNGELAFPYRVPSASGRHFLPGDIDVADQVRMWSYSAVDTDLSDRVHEWRHPETPPANVANEASYFWPNEWGKKSRPQWQDFSRSVHASKAGLSCSTCHAFHGTKRDFQLRMSRQELCVDCHNSSGLAKQPNKEIFAGSPHAEEGVTCVDCHMPRLGQRLTKTKSHIIPAWDVTLHASRAATPSLKKAHDIRTSCHSCHIDPISQSDKPADPERTKLPNGTIPSSISLDELEQRVTARQREICGKIQDAQGRIDDTQKKLDALPSPPAGVADKLDQARGKLRLLARDGSQGIHHLRTTREYIQEVYDRVDEACTILGVTCKKPDAQDACR
jgi:predicted CXXCH cytochrome family protein